LNDQLAVVDGRIRCTRCDHDICADDENYRLWVLQDRGAVDEVPLTGVGEHDVDVQLELRRYYCPGCVSQLDVEVTLPEVPPLHDVELDVA
jgi:acetone carboxylase gamma subunit